MNRAFWIIIGLDLFTEADMYNVTVSEAFLFVPASEVFFKCLAKSRIVVVWVGLDFGF